MNGYGIDWVGLVGRGGRGHAWRMEGIGCIGSTGCAGCTGCTGWGWTDGMNEQEGMITVAVGPEE